MSKKQDEPPQGSKGPNDQDEDSTPPVLSIANLANRQLLAAVGNLLLESKEHTRALQGLYTELRDQKNVAPASFAPRLLEEEERHHKRVGENVEALRALVEGGT